jgi:hypothetical protein
MKRLIAGIAIMCAAAAVVAPAAAQDTIKVSDVSTQFGVGTFTQPRWDSTVTSINIGRRGSSSWDFSGLKRSNFVTFTSTAVPGAPFATSFQGATHMLKGDINYLLNGTPIPATVYWYFQLSSTGLLNLGKGANATLGGLPASALETSIPGDTFYKLPSTLGTTWTSAYLDTTAVYVFGSWQVGFGTTHKASYVVDAWGPLTIPGGTVHQVLRIKKTDTTNSGTTTSRGVGYIFLGKDGTLITLGGSNPDAPDSGTILVNPPVQWAAPVNTSAPVAAAAPVKFSLDQNYPNPFNPSTVIAYAVPVRSSVRLAVYNLLGQLVAELVNGDVQAGSHSVEWHPTTSSGMYLCRIDAVALDNPAASFSKVLKMAYIK